VRLPAVRVYRAKDRRNALPEHDLPHLRHPAGGGVIGWKIHGKTVLV
jgi:hypothetical protein